MLNQFFPFFLFSCAKPGFLKCSPWNTLLQLVHTYHLYQSHLYFERETQFSLKLCRCCTHTCSTWALVCPWWPFSSPPCSSTGTPSSIWRRSTEIASPEPPPHLRKKNSIIGWTHEIDTYIYSPLVSVSNHHFDIGDENHPTSSWRPFGTCLASSFVPLAPWPFEPCKGDPWSLILFKISNVFPQIKKNLTFYRHSTKFKLFQKSNLSPKIPNLSQY